MRENIKRLIEGYQKEANRAKNLAKKEQDRNLIAYFSSKSIIYNRVINDLRKTLGEI